VHRNEYVCAYVYNRDIIGNTSHHIRILSVLLRSGRWGESLPDILSSGNILFGRSSFVFGVWSGATAAAVPPPFRPSDPALCGSRPLVTPYYYRLGDLLCLFCILCISFCVCIIVYVYLYLVVFVVFFLFCSIFFSTLILLVGSFDL